MSDSFSAGAWADEASKEMDKKCPKGGKHKWKKIVKDHCQCKKCGVCVYFK